MRCHSGALTWDDVTVTGDLVTVTLGGFAIALSAPLDAPRRELLRNPGHDQTAAHPNSNWVFRGHSPGQHINAMSLRDRLRRHLFSTRAARLGTLHELTKLAPVAIIAKHSATTRRRSRPTPPRRVLTMLVTSAPSSTADRAGSSDSVFVGADRSHCR
jgi:hypothetical protein